MYKQELVTAVAEKSGLLKKDAERAINAMTKSIEEALIAGDSVMILGFGTFCVKERKARTGRNPRKPEETVEVPAAKAPTFKAGKSLKAAVNK